MTELTTYRARDRRVYNGAYCSDMERERNHTEALKRRMEAAEPLAKCVYFPVEGKYMVFIKWRELNGKFHVNKQEAMIEAIQILESQE